MDVGLTSEQLSLRDTVRGILRTECPPDAARQSIDDPERWRTLWKTVVDLGWTELAAPDAAAEFGPVELAVVLEECGAAIAPIPLLSSVGLAAGVLRAVARAATGRGRRTGRHRPAASSPRWRSTPRVTVAGRTHDPAGGRAARTRRRGAVSPAPN